MKQQYLKWAIGCLKALMNPVEQGMQCSLQLFHCCSASGELCA